jgi:hypothetical protein
MRIYSAIYHQFFAEPGLKCIIYFRIIGIIHRGLQKQSFLPEMFTLNGHTWAHMGTDIIYDFALLELSLEF